MRIRRRHFNQGPVAGIGLLVLGVVSTACGGGSSPGGTAAATSVVQSSAVTTVAGVTTTTSVAPTTPSAVPTPSTVQTTSLSVFAGNFIGPTGGAGNALIKDDGTGRFEVADLIACPSCSTASAPRGTIDFKLTSAAPTGSGGYRGTGAITAESNPAQAAAIGAGPVGSSFEATLSAAGGLNLGFLRSGTVLLRTGGAASTPAPATRTDTGSDIFDGPLSCQKILAAIASMPAVDRDKIGVLAGTYVRLDPSQARALQMVGVPRNSGSGDAYDYRWTTTGGLRFNGPLSDYTIQTKAPFVLQRVASGEFNCEAR